MRWSWIVLFGAMLVVSAACATNQAGTRVYSCHSSQCVAESELVAQKLQVREYIQDQVNGLMRVQMTVENISKRDLQFEYRFRWLDAKGFEVKTNMDKWSLVWTTARDKQRIQAVAPSPLAVDFDFVIRFPNRT